MSNRETPLVNALVEELYQRPRLETVANLLASPSTSTSVLPRYRINNLSLLTHRGHWCRHRYNVYAPPSCGQRSTGIAPECFLAAQIETISDIDRVVSNPPG